MKRCENAEKEREAHRRVVSRMERRLKAKIDVKMVHMYLNDPDVTRVKMNHQMGGIRVGMRSKQALDAVSASIAMAASEGIEAFDDQGSVKGTLSHFEAAGNPLGKNATRFSFPPDLAQLEI